MRIGISVITHANQNIWENGMSQNIIFLVQSLKAIPFVKSVDLINVGGQPGMAEQIDLSLFDLRLLSEQEAEDAFDVIIELAGALNPQWLALQRARGKKVVFYCVGQPYVGLAEFNVFEKPTSFPPVDRSDEVWVLPKDKDYIPMLRTMYRCPVHVTPYLWDPMFISRRKQEISEHGFYFGWRGNLQDGVKTPLNVAIFEPNISVVKTSSIPMLACDEAYRAEPQSIGMMHVLNTLHMKDHLTMLYLANSLNLVKDHKACFYGRHDIAGFMSQHANAVVSHQWCNDQNYLYLDALYGDYPLIHNSPWLKEFGAGYYYPDFNAAEAGRQLIFAWQHHEENLGNQRQASQALFKATSPLTEANIAAHVQLLSNLCADRPELLRN
ncbi:hypothetical protein BGI05_08990 [Snodgrassella alvi]|uniref:DUF2827 domain-containing protein n=1 Tax=Snodgrassella TaxID=1193515 RepID=UPI0009FDAD68|nr:MULTISPECIES: DUF2827 domain-containing protein [Snodgrassella]MBI0159182.1 DUF2827 domain-containing protein [Snodgrassella sp. W6238H11]MBI0161368.1 DUF2827 domain-containing protein [Snodgrassella sp. W6238H14]MCT6883988.1 DUF2827 domain-containing protein [Snodgrassella alvi]ORF08896.1 hypothetical protein BGH99_04110 [Snodgrassella alvi]ORF14370.1 hypothetical protein BGI00_02405 [Snodgrassella alvi]